VIREALKYFKWSARQKSLGTSDQGRPPNIDIADKGCHENKKGWETLIYKLIPNEVTGYIW
jgi:hypothetical protein